MSAGDTSPNTHQISGIMYCLQCGMFDLLPCTSILSLQDHKKYIYITVRPKQKIKTMDKELSDWFDFQSVNKTENYIWYDVDLGSRGFMSGLCRHKVCLSDENLLSVHQNSYKLKRVLNQFNNLAEKCKTFSFFSV